MNSGTEYIDTGVMPPFGIITDKDNFYNTLFIIKFLNHNRSSFSQEDQETAIKALEEFMKSLVPIIQKYGWFIRETNKEDPEYERLIFYTELRSHQQKIRFGVQAVGDTEGDNVGYIDTFDWSEGE